MHINYNYRELLIKSYIKNNLNILLLCCKNLIFPNLPTVLNILYSAHKYYKSIIYYAY